MTTSNKVQATVTCSECGQKQPVKRQQWQGATGFACLNCGHDLSSEIELVLRKRVTAYGAAARSVAKWIDLNGGDKEDLQKVARYTNAREDLDKHRDLMLTAGEWRAQAAA